MRFIVLVGWGWVAGVEPAGWLGEGEFCDLAFSDGAATLAGDEFQLTSKVSQTIADVFSATARHLLVRGKVDCSGGSLAAKEKL